MQYNVLKGAMWEVNTVEGNVGLEFPLQYGLMDYGDTPIMSIQDDDILVVDFDFGYRLHLDTFEYKYSTPYADMSSVTSGIEFSFKNEYFDDYISLATYIKTQDIFYTTISGAVFNPRYIKIKHAVSGTLNTTTFSGAVYGFKAYNNDTIVDFGEDSQATEIRIEVVRESIPEIMELPIYNSGTKTATAYINIEPNNTDIDYAISVSNSSNGPWTYPYNMDDIIADIGSFDAGHYENLDANTAALRLTGIDVQDNLYASMYAYGIYTSRPFSVGESDYCSFVTETAANRRGHIMVDKLDVVDTIEVRSNNAPPKPYMIFREFVDVLDDVYYHYARYKDSWLETGLEKYTSSTNLFQGHRHSRYDEYNITFDQITERYAGCITTYYPTDSRSDSILYMFNNIGESDNWAELGRNHDFSSRFSYNWYETKLDYSGGMWVYLFAVAYSAADWVDNRGYYLAYFDNALVNTFKWYTAERDILTLDNDYYTKKIWYTREFTHAIYRVSYLGDVELNFQDDRYTGDLGGIAVLPDHGVVFGNDKNLLRLSYDGVIMPEYTLEDVAGYRLSYILIDLNDSNVIWAIDGQSVGRLFMTGPRAGEWDFKIAVNLPLSMEVVSGGVWIKCAGEISEGGTVMRYVSAENRRIEYEYIPQDRCVPGILRQEYAHSNYTDKMPILTDNVWYNLPWHKVNLDGYLSNEDRYYQLRMTMRRAEPIEQYPEFIIDPEQDFFSDDNFVQDTATPKQLLWGDWLSKPALDRVYVDTTASELVLVPSQLVVDDSYISTKYRMVVGRYSDAIDIRISYKLGDGNGVESGVEENIYIYMYSVSQGFEDKYMAVRFRISATPTSNDSSLYTSYNGLSWAGNNIGKIGTSYNEGEFSLYWNGSYLCGYARNSPTANWLSSGHRSVNDNSLGNCFFLLIKSSRDSSPLRLQYSMVYQGTPYYYTDTQRVTTIGKQQLVKLDDIVPNNYRNAYVRTYVPRDLNVTPESELDIKVRWRVPTY